jgi:hypothetical protein
VYVKKRVTGETNYNVPQTNLGQTNGVQARAFWVDSANAKEVTDWVVGTVQSRATSGGTTANVAPGVTTAVNNSMVFAISEERTSASEVDGDITVSGTGWAKRLGWVPSSASEASITFASKGLASAGASGDCTVTYVNTQATNGAAFQIVIPPIPDAVPDSVPGKLWNGSALVDGSWFVAGPSDTILGVAWAGLIWPGYASIADMLARDAFYIGHRGGSRNWPEMSLQGYTQAALRGFGALEVSLARTSDGVWFGLHDASLDRTSLGTGGGSGTTYVASAMTWAQVQTHDILPATGSPVDTTHRPYVQLDDMLDAYLESHVLFIDPKAALAYRDELIAILKNRPEWQTRIVAKYVPGNSNNSWLAVARTAGFVTNAMFYPGDNFATYHGQADILGMTYDASSSVWTSIKALGKPVISHVCPTQTAINQGKNSGAAGAMVSGPVQAPRVAMTADRSALVGGTYEPSPETTGIVGGLGARGSLTVVNGDVTHSSTQTYTNTWFKGKVLRRANNLIYNNCWFSDVADCDDTTAAYSGTQYNDCTFEAETCTVSDHDYAIVGYGFTATRCKFRRFKDGIRIRSRGGNVSTIVYIQQCYMDELLWWSSEGSDGTHNDCIQIEGGCDFVVRWNSLHGYSSQVAGFGNQPTGRNANQPQSMSCMMYNTNVSTKLIGDVHHNWFYGGEIMLNVTNDSLTGVNVGSITDNVFAPDSYYVGHTLDYQTGMTYTQSNNKYIDGSAIVLHAG